MPSRPLTSPLPAALLTAVLAAGAARCSTPTGAVLEPAPQATTTPTTTSGTTCTSNYHHGIDSLDLIMQNATGQTLTLDQTWSKTDGGHWAARPPATIAAGDCAVINA